ncbi:Crp/Fnr family transcriptional regulator [Zongyangia hominis]|uniref:Crp/Fnr family transcriptional regulator n=1 Tax=Zongyangia hominis TaxID=2763677 RepID=A0A926IA55_9FIRM|nr:Crp/Fnr family transcriptional regulator [Zongyangia hominis]MBC8569866.1 Crp/Fnr family transcriptional regulator [Zongyangia hominis]
MKNFFDVLTQCPLFQGMEVAKLPELLACLEAKVTAYGKYQPVFLEGDPAKDIGIVLSGEVQIVKEDYFGNRNIVALIEPSQIFGEAFACAGVETLPVSAVASCGSEVMLIGCGHIITPCKNSCADHNRLIYNLLQVMASKNLFLNKKLEFVSKRTTKEKLMAFLLEEAKRYGGDTFTIQYNRQELADYLGVERSAMSAELGKLRDDGKIKFHKNHFQIL